MAVGDLVHGEAFSLFESMSAVECGNPKMDAAAVAARSSVEELLAAGAAPVAELTPAQLIDVLDRLLVMEVGWLDGGALAQTIYTSLYMLRPARLVDHAVLSAYCSALRATVHSVRTLVVVGGVAEEEDFAFHTAGLPLDDAPSDSSAESTRASGSTKDARMLALEDALASCSAASAPQGASSGQLGSEAERTAIADRLMFRQELHQGLAAVNETSSRDTAAAVRHFAAATALLVRMRATSPTGAAAAAAAAASKAAAAASAAPPAPTSADPSASSSGGSEPDMLGFDMEVNRHLLGPAPPRVVKLLAHNEACDFFTTLLHHLTMAVDISNCTSYTSLQAAVQRFGRLGASALPRSVAHYLVTPKAWGAAPLPACVPGRDMLAAAVGLPTTPAGPVGSADATPQAGAGAGPSSGEGLETEATGGAAGVSSQSAAPAASAPRAAGPLPAPGPDVELFLEQATIAASNWVQAQLMNRSRQRRRVRRGFEDWANLYEHSVNADASEGMVAFLAAAGWDWTANTAGQDTQGLLAAWVERHTCACVVQHLTMGFSLDLYHPHEFAMIYWHCDYLLSIVQQTSHVLYERHPVAAASMREQLEAQQALTQPKPPPSPPREAAGKAGKSKVAKAAAAAKRSAASAQAAASSEAAAAAAPVFPQSATEMLVEVQATHLALEVERHLCQAMLRMLVGLSKAGLLKTPYGPNGADPPFNSEVQRYDQRFAVLHTLPRPDPLFYDQYLQSVEASAVDVTHLLGHSGDALLTARQALRQVAAHSVQTLSGNPEAAAEAQLKWRALDRVALQNCVALNVVNTGLRSGNPMVVTFDFTHHPTYPVIVVKGQKQAVEAK